MTVPARHGFTWSTARGLLLGIHLLAESMECILDIITQLFDVSCILTLDRLSKRVDLRLDVVPLFFRDFVAQFHKGLFSLVCQAVGRVAGFN